jgi:hypothetical protein
LQLLAERAKALGENRFFDPEYRRLSKNYHAADNVITTLTTTKKPGVPEGPRRGPSPPPTASALPAPTAMQRATAALQIPPKPPVQMTPPARLPPSPLPAPPRVPPPATAPPSQEKRAYIPYASPYFLR